MKLNNKMTSGKCSRNFDCGIGEGFGRRKGHISEVKKKQEKDAGSRVSIERFTIAIFTFKTSSSSPSSRCITLGGLPRPIVSCSPRALHPQGPPRRTAQAATPRMTSISADPDSLHLKGPFGTSPPLPPLAPRVYAPNTCRMPSAQPSMEPLIDSWWRLTA